MAGVAQLSPLKGSNKMNGKKYIIIASVITLALFVAGWTQNIYKLSQCDFEAPYRAEILYGIGVIPVVGGVIGWFNIEDGGQ